MGYEAIIDNFTNNETVQYPVIIIKGHLIEKSTDHQCQNNEQIQLVATEFTDKFPIINAKFKILLELNLGENLIKLQYCCQSTTIILHYNQRSSPYSIIPLYIICDSHNGEFQAPETERNDVQSACDRINTCSKLLQSIFSEKLYEENLGRKSFILNSNCEVLYSKLNYLESVKMNQQELWEYIGRELLNSNCRFTEKHKFLAFLSWTKYNGEEFTEKQSSHDDLIKLTEAYVALGGGGLALIGTPCLFTWPENIRQVIERFQDKTLIDRKKFLDDSFYRGTYGACFSTTLGSVLHELCHTFDLGHSSNGVMGRGFDNIQEIFLVGNSASNISQMHQTSIEFKERFSSGLLSERLNESPKEYIIKNTQIKDDTFWTKSCLMILAYHRWFNDIPSQANIILKYDPESRIITSTKGLRVIELRRENDGFIVENWIFEGRVLKYSFQIPEISLKGNIDLVIVDNVGNIFKETFKK